MITRKTIVIAFLIFYTYQSHAQQNHFVYIKADNKENFSATVNDSIYNSAEGFVIIPGLKNSGYSLSLDIKGIGSTKQFAITIDNADYGFALKNLGEKGWCLYEYNTANIITAIPDKMDEDLFSSMLSQVTNDSTIAVRNTPVANNSTPAFMIDTLMKVKQDTVETSNELLPVIADSAINADTIKEKTIQPIMIDTAAVIIQDTTATQNKEMANPFFETQQSTADSLIAIIPLTNPSTISKDEITCKGSFAEQDMDKLRRKMFATSGDEKMIAIAVKSIRENCVSVSQMKTLGLLFSTDSSRYRFFEILDKNIADKENLYLLESQLISPYYKNLFRALIQ